MLIYVLVSDPVTNWDKADTFANFLIAFLAIAAAIVAWKSLGHSRRMGITQTRPWIIPRAEIVNDRLRITLTNHGPSPARQIVVKIEPNYYSVLHGSVADSPLMKHPTDVLAPGGTMAINIDSATNYFDAHYVIGERPDPLLITSSFEDWLNQQEWVDQFSINLAGLSRYPRASERDAFHIRYELQRWRDSPDRAGEDKENALYIEHLAGEIGKHHAWLYTSFQCLATRATDTSVFRAYTGFAQWELVDGREASDGCIYILTKRGETRERNTVVGYGIGWETARAMVAIRAIEQDVLAGDANGWNLALDLIFRT